MVKLVTVRFQGRSALHQKFNFLERSLASTLKVAMKKSGKLIRDDARPKIPVWKGGRKSVGNAGDLKRSLRVKVATKSQIAREGERGEVASVAIFTSAANQGPHSHWIQTGSAGHDARPYLPNSLKRNEDAIKKIVSQEMKALFRKASVLRFGGIDKPLVGSSGSFS